jgi:transposase-like protein
MAAHAPPFYCPYCGDEDIRPFGEKHGDWRCGACRRVWTLRYVGLARPESARPGSADQGMSTPVGGLEQA